MAHLYFGGNILIGGDILRNGAKKWGEALCAIGDMGRNLLCSPWLALFQYWSESALPGGNDQGDIWVFLPA